MAGIIYRQLIGHEDLALGIGKVSQQRGDLTLQFKQIELEFIFENAGEIKVLDYNVYRHVAIHQVGPVIQYHFDPSSYATADDVTVIRPNKIQATQPGRYIVSNTEPLDTIIASASDEYTPLEVATTLTTFRAPYPLLLQYIRCSLTTAPDGADLIVDVKMDGVTVFSTPMHIDPGERTSVTAAIQASLAIISAPDDAEFTVDVMQIGSVAAGTGLKVAVTGRKVLV